MVLSVRHLSLIKMKQPARIEHYTVQDNGISVSIVSETGIGLRETTPAGWNSSFLAPNVAEETKRRGKREIDDLVEAVRYFARERRKIDDVRERKTMERQKREAR